MLLSLVSRQVGGVHVFNTPDIASVIIRSAKIASVGMVASVVNHVGMALFKEAYEPRGVAFLASEALLSAGVQGVSISLALLLACYACCKIRPSRFQMAPLHLA